MQALRAIPTGRAALALVLLAALALSACGRRGDPLPPPSATVAPTGAETLATPAGVPAP